MSTFEATKELKQGPDGINIEPSPNPKPLKVERINTPILGEHGLVVGYETLIIRNANLHPDALTERW